MTTDAIIIAAIVVFIVFALGLFIGSKIRKGREVEKTLDYSKMREWRDDEDD